MYLTQRYFSIFSVFLVFSAVFFSRPERTVALLSLLVLALSLVSQYLVARIQYRFVRWIRLFRVLQLWLSFFWSIPLIYLLGQWWGPMWLLFLWTPCTAALSFGRGKTLGISLGVALALLGVYALRGLSSPAGWGQAAVHAAFIVFFSLFVQSLAELSLRLRDGAQR